MQPCCPNNTGHCFRQLCTVDFGGAPPPLFFSAMGGGSLCDVWTSERSCKITKMRARQADLGMLAFVAHRSKETVQWACQWAISARSDSPLSTATPAEHTPERPPAQHTVQPDNILPQVSHTHTDAGSQEFMSIRLHANFVCKFSHVACGNLCHHKSSNPTTMAWYPLAIPSQQAVLDLCEGLEAFCNVQTA